MFDSDNTSSRTAAETEEALRRENKKLRKAAKKERKWARTERKWARTERKWAWAAVTSLVTVVAGLAAAAGTRQ